jgi:hypothetical protein
MAKGGRRTWDKNKSIRLLDCHYAAVLKDKCISSRFLLSLDTVNSLISILKAFAALDLEFFSVTAKAAGGISSGYFTHADGRIRYRRSAEEGGFCAATNSLKLHNSVIVGACTDNQLYTRTYSLLFYTISFISN